MSIAYIWLKDYGNLKDFEMNFSPDITFHYNASDKTITACERKQKNNFLALLGYNNIYNATAIIGENGSGKSTIIHNLMDLQNDAGTFSEAKKYIIVFYKDNQYIAFTNLGSLQMNCSSLGVACTLKYSAECGYNNKLKAAFENNVVINFTEAFNAARYHELVYYNKRTENDYSVEGRIVSYKKKYFADSKNTDPIQFYQFKWVEEQIRVIKDFSEITGFSNELSIDIVEYKEVKSNVLKSIDDLQAEIAEKYGKGKYYRVLYAFVNNLTKRMLLSMKLASEKGAKTDIIKMIVKRMISKVKQYENELTVEELISIVDVLDEFPKNKVLNISDEEKKAYAKVLKYLCEMSEKLAYREDINRFLYSPGTDNGWDELVDFYDAYSKTTFNGECSYLKFSWGMSTGEMAQLNLFATVNDVLKNMKNKSADITFFFDEAGLYWHPKWQQEGLKRILDILNKANNRMQLIVATHSPIFLSDFPKSDTYWMPVSCRKDEECLETFGANIYNLYNDAFLWHTGNESLWVSGEFSQSVISEISSRLLKLSSEDNIYGDVKEELDILKNDIEQIGEEIIRRELLSKWEKVYNKFCQDNGSEEDSIVAQINGLSEDRKMKLLERLRSDHNG